MPDKIWSNPVLGTETFYDYDEAEGEIILATRQNVEAIVEANKAAMNNVSSPRFGEGKLVARISMVVLLQLIEEGILDWGFNTIDEKRFSDWLNSSDNRDFRTWPGRV